MVGVAGTVEVARHHGNEIRPMLPPVGLAQLDASDLGDGIPLVCGLKRAREELRLNDRLASELRINAGRPQKEELLDAGVVGGGDRLRWHYQIIVDEIGGRPGVGGYAAPPAGGQCTER